MRNRVDRGGCDSTLDAAMGLPRSSISASRMLALLMPDEVNRSLTPVACRHPGHEPMVPADPGPEVNPNGFRPVRNGS